MQFSLEHDSWSPWICWAITGGDHSAYNIESRSLPLAIQISGIKFCPQISRKVLVCQIPFLFFSTSLLLPTHLPPPSCTHAQSCNPMDFSLPDSSVHGFFQARILGWVAISFSCQIPFLSCQNNNRDTHRNQSFWILMPRPLPIPTTKQHLWQFLPLKWPLSSLTSVGAGRS